MSRAIGRRFNMVALVAAALLLGIVFVPRVGNVLAGATGIHDAAAVAGEISICGRDWSKDSFDRKLSLVEIRSRDGVEPVIVDPGQFAQCPAGPCTRVAQNDPCNTLIYAQDHSAGRRSGTERGATEVPEPPARDVLAAA